MVEKQKVRESWKEKFEQVKEEDLDLALPKSEWDEKPLGVVNL